MYDFMVQNSIFVVLAIVLTIWFTIAFYIYQLDSKISKVEKRLDNEI